MRRRRLSTAYCLLPTATAYCLLPTAYCLLPTAYCLLPTAYCLLIGFRPATLAEHRDLQREGRSRALHAMPIVVEDALDYRAVVLGLHLPTGGASVVDGESTGVCGFTKLTCVHECPYV